MRRPRRPANELRIAVECLPIDTKRAMLDGLETNPIIVGAYTDRSGGVCPMLAAHRSGGRTSLPSFARAWDRYTRAGKGARPATERERSTLRSMLESGLAADEQARAELEQHRATRERPSAADPESDSPGSRRHPRVTPATAAARRNSAPAGGGPGCASVAKTTTQPRCRTWTPRGPSLAAQSGTAGRPALICVRSHTDRHRQREYIPTIGMWRGDQLVQRDRREAEEKA